MIYRKLHVLSINNVTLLEMQMENNKFQEAPSGIQTDEFCMSYAEGI